MFKIGMFGDERFRCWETTLFVEHVLNVGFLVLLFTESEITLANKIEWNLK